MATYDLDQAQFVDTLTNFDPDTINSILNYLHAHGIFSNPNDTAVVQINSLPPVDPAAQIAAFSASSFTVRHGSLPNIHAIIGINPGDTTAILTGHEDVLLATDGNDVLADQVAATMSYLADWETTPSMRPAPAPTPSTAASATTSSGIPATAPTASRWPGRRRRLYHRKR